MREANVSAGGEFRVRRHRLCFAPAFRRMARQDAASRIRAETVSARRRARRSGGWRRLFRIFRQSRRALRNFPHCDFLRAHRAHSGVRIPVYEIVRAQFHRRRRDERLFAFRSGDSPLRRHIGMAAGMGGFDVRNDRDRAAALCGQGRRQTDAEGHSRIVRTRHDRSGETRPAPRRMDGDDSGRDRGFHLYALAESSRDQQGPREDGCLERALDNDGYGAVPSLLRQVRAVQASRMARKDTFRCGTEGRCGDGGERSRQIPCSQVAQQVRRLDQGAEAEGDGALPHRKVQGQVVVRRSRRKAFLELRSRADIRTLWRHSAERQHAHTSLRQGHARPRLPFRAVAVRRRSAFGLSARS